jgi:predicted peroxiredoxin
MKKLMMLLVAVVVFSFLSCQSVDADNEPTTDGVFVHISHGSDDVHRLLMGLQMAVLMSEDKDVLVYFDIAGIEAVLKNSEDFTYSHFPSSHTQLKFLLENGVTVMACPGCMKAAGVTTEDLMDGIQVADKDQFFNFTSGRILTIDY